MKDNVFIDSNIWLYALIQSQTDDEKRLIAKNCIVEAKDIIVSTQVVNEVCVNLMRKASKDNAYIEQFVSDFVATYAVVAQTKEDVLQAASIRRDYDLSYWDSLIVTCALRSECSILLTEDMQQGLIINKQLEICNPF
ncbi:MAG: PIN domain-containing protein [Gammaproteobacteria bacterium]|jgi:predicted nucleic acid-binding protein|nr:PIN domain-containing protein [Gammaproteobacteria bacterium]MBT5222703.1 PIN domain-containing protein [Gammaproteobacteria bacterium]MBT5825711.1 PIN domain-containing protein [Gammaproteobacteria bacterium]MBT6421064.1 PIN domain-containing protein [Gammaproteobacteria bacterium]MBT6575533.1 PIN domain-containing protein [Gammaproteobacteria bacterium]